MKRKPMVVIGGGGHGGCVADVAERAGWSVVGFIDTELEPGQEVIGRPVLGNDDRLADEAFCRAHDFGLGIGEPQVRRRYGRKILERGGTVPAIVNPSAFVSSRARMGQGVLLMGFNAVNHQARLGDFVVLDWHATVGHHSSVGEACFLSPGVNVTGRVTMGAEVYLGAGCRVVPEVSIGEGTVVGAGATVTSNLPNHVLAVGTPAVVKKHLR